MNEPRRLLRRACAILLLSLLLVVVSGAPANAHAQLEATSPQNGATLSASPEEIRLEFGEAVTATLGGVRLYDSNGKEFDVDAPEHPSGNSDVVTARVHGVADGTYVVAWRAVSADSHPVHGAFSFHVGAGDPADTDALAAKVLSANNQHVDVAAVFAITRFVLFAALCASTGLLVIGLTLWPSGWRRLRPPALAATGLVLLASVVGIALQGPYTAGFGLSDVFRWSVLGDVLDTRFGQAWLARAVVAAALGLLLTASVGVPGRARALIIGAVALLLVVPSSVSGHASVGDWYGVAMVIDALHLASVSTWLGGLVAVVLAMRTSGRPSDESTETESTETESTDTQADQTQVDIFLRRFSRRALVLVGVIVVTGTVAGWRELRSFDSLFGTTYGRLLLVKVALFLLLLSVANRSRRALASKLTLKPLVTVELIIGALVLAVGALLVSAQPVARDEGKQFAAEMSAPNLLVDVTIDPARTGPAVLHLYTLTAAGAIVDVPDVTARLSGPDANVDALPIELRKVTGGHYVTDSLVVPFSGTCVLEVIVRTTDIDQVTLRTSVEVK